MFTGIIETLGEVEGLERVTGGGRLSVKPQQPIDALIIGESIALSGVCLTAEPESRGDRLVFYMSAETLGRTTLGGLRRGALVNMERALRPDSRLGGHLVAGHVDGIGAIRRFDRHGESWTLEVTYPTELTPFIAAKGSIAVNGISLTPVTVTAEAFTVAAIPHTVEMTNLRQAAPGTVVNLEVDMLARYVVRALEVYGPAAWGGAGGAVSMDLLRRAGF